MKKQNLQNEKTNINFIWLYDFQRLIATEKIINGKKIEMHDIIPNNAEIISQNRARRDCDTIFFLQNIVSWAINFPENPVRIVINPMYSYMLNNDDIESVFQIQNLDEKKIKVKKLCEQKIKKKYNTRMTLEKIEEKYDECFQNFETELKKYNQNFSIVKFEDLANEYLTEEEIASDDMLRFLLKENAIHISEKIFGEIDHYRKLGSAIDAMRVSLNWLGFGYKKNLTINAKLGSAIDAMRVSLNWFGFGYEKNLTIDMDNSLNTLKILQLSEESESKFEKILLNDENINSLGEEIKIAVLVGERCNNCENSLLYTSKTKDKTLKEIKSIADKDTDESWKKSTDHDRSIYGITKNLIESDDYTGCSGRLGISMNSENVTKYCLSFTDDYRSTRTFEQTNLISLTKTSLPIIFTKDFWPQDELFKQTRKESIYYRDIKAQKILHEIYGKYKNLNLDNSKELNESKKILT